MSDARLQPEPGIFDLESLLALLIARIWWIIAAIVLFTAAFAAAIVLMTPVYRAAVLLAPAKAEQGLGGLSASLSQLGGLASLAGLSLGDANGRTNESIAVLTSFDFTNQFIIEQGLMQKLFADQWDPSTGSWQGNAARHPTPAKAFGYFDRKIRTVSQDRRNGLVTLEIEWTDRHAAAAWANLLVERLNLEMRKRALAQAEASIRFLEAEFAKTTVVQTRDAISRLIESQVEQRMLVTVSEEYAFRIIDPAVPPDEDNPVRPNKLLMMLAGPMAGLIFGVLVALSYDVVAGAMRSARSMRGR